MEKTMYLGHSKDGSSIQNHSVGPLYPCIIYAQETPNGLQWGLITPENQRGSLYGTYADAFNAGLAYNEK